MHKKKFVILSLKSLFEWFLTTLKKLLCYNQFALYNL